jgi:type II secretory pathway pseudopilin PulG
MIFGLRRVHAFSLVEVTLAIGVAAFCLLAVFGLMPIGVQTNRNATSQTAATNIMAAVIADMRATPKDYDDSKTYYVGDSAFLSGNCYSAIAQTTGHPPPNPTYWSAGSACPQYGITFGTDTTLYFDGSGQFTTLPGANSRYRLTITWNPNAPSGSSWADLKVTWPAPVDPATTTPSGSAEMFAAFDRH